MSEKIKKIIETYTDYGFGDWEGIKSHQIESFVSEIAEALNGWTPISEGLPGSKGACLVTAKHTGMDEFEVFRAEYEGFGFFRICGNLISEFEVIAWAKLPSPYSEGK